MSLLWELDTYSRWTTDNVAETLMLHGGVRQRSQCYERHLSLISTSQFYTEWFRLLAVTEEYGSYLHERRHTKLGYENLMTGHLEDLDIDARIILKLMWTGFTWIRLRTSGGLLWIVYRTYDSQGLYSMKKYTKWAPQTPILLLKGYLTR
jgi:hypothetical protein